MKQLIYVILLFGVFVVPTIHARPSKVKKNIKTVDDNEKKDVESRIPEDIKEGGKFFQDIYSAQNSPHEIEFGHVRETPDDWEQRFEKADFEKNTRQGKVRWGDKNGGYGEHYWDFNHAGAADEEEQVEAEDEETKQQPQYVEASPPSAEAPASEESAAALNSRIQRQTNDAEFINDEARLLYKSGKMQKHGGNYRREAEVHVDRAKRENNLNDY